MNPQLQLTLENLSQADVDALVQLLKHRGWLTRKDLVHLTGKSERALRLLAEAAGPDIVRGPKGFNHFDNAALDEIDHAARISESQGKKMLRYALRLKRRAHARLETTQPTTS